MNSKKEILLRLSELFSDASELLKQLAAEEISHPPEDNVTSGEDSENHILTSESAINDRSLNVEDYGDEATRSLLEEKGVTIRHIGQVPPEAEGLLTLAGMMGQKIETIRPFLDQVKRAQSSRRRILMDLSRKSQDAISDITLIANLANKAGLLPNYWYSRSPRYKLSVDAPVSPIAINFFNGQWLELYALKTIFEIEEKSGAKLCPLSQVQVELPNGDQFDLDLVFTVDGRLVWVEAKTTDDFERLLPKYKAISKLLCESPRDAILLWSNYSNDNSLLTTRGALARMTLCAPKDFPPYISNLCAEETPRGANDSELA
jgi:hypothetical protein